MDACSIARQSDGTGKCPEDPCNMQGAGASVKLTDCKTIYQYMSRKAQFSVVILLRGLLHEKSARHAA